MEQLFVITIMNHCVKEIKISVFGTIDDVVRMVNNNLSSWYHGIYVDENENDMELDFIDVDLVGSVDSINAVLSTYNTSWYTVSVECVDDMII